MIEITYTGTSMPGTMPSVLDKVIDHTIISVEWSTTSMLVIAYNDQELDQYRLHQSLAHRVSHYEYMRLVENGTLQPDDHPDEEESQ